MLCLSYSCGKRSARYIRIQRHSIRDGPAMPTKANILEFFSFSFDVLCSRCPAGKTWSAVYVQKYRAYSTCKNTCSCPRLIRQMSLLSIFIEKSVTKIEQKSQFIGEQVKENRLLANFLTKHFSSRNFLSSSTI
jgi:hypothetical protein